MRIVRLNKLFLQIFILSQMIAVGEETGKWKRFEQSKSRFEVESDQKLKH